MSTYSEPLSDAIGYGVAASRPAAGIAGRVYYATDTHALSRDNGTTWDAVTPTSGGTVVLDDLTDVTITTPANANRLRYDSSASLWKNSNLVWEPMIASDGSVMTDGLLNPMMSEVPY